jgi:hypothetical protein
VAGEASLPVFLRLQSRLTVDKPHRMKYDDPTFQRITMRIDYTMIQAAQLLGVSGVLVALRSAQSREEWQSTAGAFVAAGLPMVMRGVVQKLS